MLPDPAHVLLSKARDDERLALLVMHDASVNDEQIGFLAQQAIKKALKAVLSYHRTAYRRTHDLSELLDLIRGTRIAIPAELEGSTTLTPFATEMRYDYLPIEPDDTPFDREMVMQLVRLALNWAEKVIGPDTP